MSIADYLVWLGQSADHLKKHLKHPRKTMNEKEVSPHDQAVLLGGDPDEIAGVVATLPPGTAVIVCGNPTIIVS